MGKPATISQLRIAHLRDHLQPERTDNSGSPESTGPNDRLKFLAVKTMEGTYLIAQDEINRCSADNNYCLIYYGDDKELLSSKTLKAVLDQLDPSLFIRLHQSHVVKTSEIRLVQKDKVTLRNGDILPLSRAQRPVLMTLISRFANKI